MLGLLFVIGEDMHITFFYIKLISCCYVDPNQAT